MLISRSVLSATISILPSRAVSLHALPILIFATLLSTTTAIVPPIAAPPRPPAADNEPSIMSLSILALTLTLSFTVIIVLSPINVFTLLLDTITFIAPPMVNEDCELVDIAAATVTSIVSIISMAACT